MKRLTYSGLLALTLATIIAVVVLPSLASVWADDYIIDTGEDWEKWVYPPYTITGVNQGQVTLRYVHTYINAATWYPDVTASAGCNKEQALNILDGDPSTWWGPDQDADVKDWWIEMNLGRAVSATWVKLHFPPHEQAKSFQQFSVYVSDGMPDPASGEVEYTLLARNTEPNTWSAAEYSFDYSYSGIDTMICVDVCGELAQLVRYVKVVLDAKSENPGLAELEISASGENIAPWTLHGGSLRAGSHQSEIYHICDEDIGSYWTIPTSGDLSWEKEGAWFEWDLGAVYWLNTIALLGGPPGYGTSSPDVPNHLEGYVLAVSDGSQTPDGDTIYKELADVENETEPFKYRFWHTFGPRRVRYIFFRHAHGTSSRHANILEMQLFGQGYVAGVTMTSPIIDLGKSQDIRSVEWVADTPPGTRIRIRARTGITVCEVKHYYNKHGMEISEDEYYKLPSLLRGPIGTKIVPDDTWSGWYPTHVRSAESFLAPSPCRYVQLEVRLLSDDPMVAPTLDSITLSETSGITAVFQQVRRNQLPDEFELCQNYPNPFNPATIISFSAPKQSQVKIAVYNILGQLVRELTDQEYASGAYHVQWDGRDSANTPVASGVYLYRMKTEAGAITKRMVLLR